MKKEIMETREIQPDELGRRKKHMSRKMAYILSTVLGSMLIFGVAVATLLLTQTVPVVTAQAVLSTTCIDGAHPLTANVSTFVSGATSYIRFTCTADSSVGYTTKGGIQSTPTFTLPNPPFSQLWSFAKSTSVGTTCAGGTSAWQMTSGSPHTFGAGTLTWDYCAVIPNTSSVDSTQFTVAWSA
jgi:hypothetical protein